MHIYQFIKYNQETTLDHLLKKAKTGAILCFDFEDGIQNPIDPYKTIELKATYRKYFMNLVHNNYAKLKDLKIGVRINFSGTNELNKDIKFLKSINLHSIFLPKIENQSELFNTIDKLNAANISYKEIIPVIESSKGIKNLEEILKINLLKIKSIAFGHCDYNLSLNIFPFFHQDSIEYWKWIDKILSIITHQNIAFINSPYLKLKDDSFFRSMLNYLEIISGNNFGQITLSNKQSQLCAEYSENNENFKKLIDNRYELYASENYTRKLIYDFESKNNEKGFTKFDNEIISYQEYISTKKYVQFYRKKNIRITFVGGCFLIQQNLLFEDLFHQILKRKIEKEKEVKINLIRYERFVNVIEKIVKLNNKRKIDILIFSIRPEQYLRLIKLYYKHLDKNGKLKHSLNLPLFNILSPEKYDILRLGRKYDYNSRAKNSFFHKLLVDCNYLLGKLIGNQKYALKKYLEIVQDVGNYCDRNNIKLILLGPYLRSNTQYEPTLCRNLDRFIKISIKDIDYINGLDTEISHGEPLLNKNGILVNEKYHKLIAERLFIALKKNNLLNSTKPIHNMGFSVKPAGRQVESKCKLKT